MRFRLAAANNRFHCGEQITAKAKSEKGERLEDRGDGTTALYIDGKFVAIIRTEA